MLQYEQYETGLLIVPDPRPYFYADVPEPLASKSCADLMPQATQSFLSCLSAPAWAGSEYAGRRVYIRCLQDAAVPSAVQTKWIKDTEVDWEIIDLDTSHSPFLSRPNELATCLEGLAEKFGKVTVLEDSLIP